MVKAYSDSKGVTKAFNLNLLHRLNRELNFNFDVEQFQSNTFNFVYSENTNTLSIKKIWVWLPLLFISLSLSIHAFVNLLERFTAKAQYKEGTL